METNETSPTFLDSMTRRVVAWGSTTVLYVGDDAAVSLLLEEALGAPFAEGGL